MLCSAVRVGSYPEAVLCSFSICLWRATMDC
eukprot:COSAG04_NODE_6404_length_1334_cov_1.220243_1_plen_30_part_10